MLSGITAQSARILLTKILHSFIHNLLLRINERRPPRTPHLIKFILSCFYGAYTRETVAFPPFKDWLELKESFLFETWSARWMWTRIAGSIWWVCPLDIRQILLSNMSLRNVELYWNLQCHSMTCFSCQAVLAARWVMWCCPAPNVFYVDLIVSTLIK